MTGKGFSQGKGKALVSFKRLREPTIVVDPLFIKSGLTDVCLLVGDTKFYTSKAKLAEHSEYFRDLFDQKSHTLAIKKNDVDSDNDKDKSEKEENTTEEESNADEKDDSSEVEVYEFEDLDPVGVKSILQFITFTSDDPDFTNHEILISAIPILVSWKMESVCIVFLNQLKLCVVNMAEKSLVNVQNKIEAIITFLNDNNFWNDADTICRYLIQCDFEIDHSFLNSQPVIDDLMEERQITQKLIADLYYNLKSNDTDTLITDDRDGMLNKIRNFYQVTKTKKNDLLEKLHEKVTKITKKNKLLFELNDNLPLKKYRPTYDEDEVYTPPTTPQSSNLEVKVQNLPPLHFNMTTLHDSFHSNESRFSRSNFLSTKTSSELFSTPPSILPMLTSSLSGTLPSLTLTSNLSDTLPSLTLTSSLSGSLTTILYNSPNTTLPLIYSLPYSLPSLSTSSTSASSTSSSNM